MADHVERLLSIASPALAPSARLGDLPATKLAEGLAELLARRNGFYAFEGALHVRPSTVAPNEYSVAAWNDAALWRSTYDGLTDGCVFFAEDAFGGQFAVVDDDVVTFDPETGDREAIARSIDGWAQLVLDDYEFLTGHPLMHDWQVQNGALPIGHRLVPRKPFVLGGEYEAANLVGMDAVDAMRYRGEIAVQIRDLPDGAQLQIKLID